MNFEQDFSAKFGDKYSFLQLRNVVVDKKNSLCTITFLYLSSIDEMTDAQKNEIIDWLKQNLTLEKLTLKVKFMRVFVEEKLILKAINNFFQTKHKIVTTYVSNENIKVKITPIDVLISLELSPRMTEYFASNKIANELSKYLKENFLVEFVVETFENTQIFDEVDIDSVMLKTKARPQSRYKVEIVKDVVGKSTATNPEYLNFITAPKTNVVVAGFIKKIERREFVIKKGKRVGQSKAYFNILLADGKGKLECIYFCPKTYERDMDALEEYMYVLLHGDVRKNQMGKLCLYIDKIALATQVETEQESLKDEKPSGHVVEIEKIMALEQNSMFEQKNKYSNRIMGKTIVVFDIETTGLDPNVDQIIELGAVKIENGNIIEKFSTFVKPTIQIPYEVVRLTGITDEMVEDAPPVDAVIKDFYDFTRGCVLSGHNVIDFDIKFIRREADNIGLTFDNDIIDTLKEARVARLNTSKFNLANVAKILGVSLEGAHRAWNDAFATAQVLLRLNEI